MNDTGPISKNTVLSTEDLVKNVDFTLHVLSTTTTAKLIS